MELIVSKPVQTDLIQKTPTTNVKNVTTLVKNVQVVPPMNVLLVQAQNPSTTVNVLKTVQLITTLITEFVIHVMPNVLNVITDKQNNVKNVTKDST